MNEVTDKAGTKSRAVKVDNIFRALDLPDAQIERDKVRLAAAINRVLAERGTTQASRALVLGVAQPVVSNLERYELAGISVERLMRYAHHLKLQVTVTAAPASHSKSPAPRL